MTCDATFISKMYVRNIKKVCALEWLFALNLHDSDKWRKTNYFLQYSESKKVLIRFLTIQVHSLFLNSHSFE